MNNYFKLFIFLILTLFSSAIKAQETTISGQLDNEVQQRLENLAETTGNEEEDYSNLLNSLIYYKQHPININYTHQKELESLNILTDIQIYNLLHHIRTNGKIITIYELQGISGFDLQSIQKLLPYVTIDENFKETHFDLNEIKMYGENMFVFRYAKVLEQQEGFKSIDSSNLFKSQNSRYIGSPDKLYAHYRFTYLKNISVGITAEKDQGELFWKKNQKFNYNWYENSLNGKQKNGFDFYSIHFFLQNIKFIKSLVIGDYQATFGQGLTIWNGLSFGKSSDILTIKKSATEIRPYTSVDESNFMRGVATTIGVKKIETTIFYSRKYIDANITSTAENEEAITISSLQKTGYHTTPNEIADKDAILQTLIGGNVSYKGEQLNLGLNIINYELEKQLKRNVNYYNQFDFSGKQNLNIGINYNYIFKNMNFFGEQAISKNGGKAFLNAVLISLDSRLSCIILNRNYKRDFQNLMSNSFAESSNISNEKGTYIGIITKPNNKTELTAYYDRFEFPWMKYEVNGPSKGSDYTIQFNYTPSKKFDTYLRIRQRNKEENANDKNTSLDYLIPTKQTNYRFHIAYSILPNIKLKNRIELIYYKVSNNKSQNGYLAYQDITYNKIGHALSVTLRYALFQTSNYDTRIYAYENDLPGVYSIPAYYYRGSRFYFLLNYNLSKKIELWIRYSQTVYDDKKIISEGSLSEIEGNTKSEIKAQIKFKF